MTNDQIYARHCARKGTTVAKMMAKIARECSARLKRHDARVFPKILTSDCSTKSYVEEYYSRNFGSYTDLNGYVEKLFAPLNTAPVCYPDGEECIYSEDVDYVEPVATIKQAKRTRADAAKDLAQLVLALNPTAGELGEGMCRMMQAFAAEYLSRK